MILRRILGIVGGGTALFSLLLVIVALSEALGWSESKNSVAMSVGLVIFFLGTTLGGGWLARWGFTDPPAPDAAPSDRAAQIRLILNLAKQSGGDVTHLQVATETPLSIEQSRSLLDHLVNEGLAQMQVDDEGVMLYVFPDLKESTASQQLPPV